jgi:hypothetical protein
MEQVAVPFYQELLNLFRSHKNETLVLMACYARNADQFGCCSDEIINKRTGLSSDTIQNSFKILIKNNRFEEKKCRKNTRYGRIIDQVFLNIYQDYYPHLQKIHNCFLGKIIDINPIQKTVTFNSLENIKYVLHCANNTSPIFFISLGTFIQFNGYVLENSNSCVHILMQEHTLRCFSSIENELLSNIEQIYQ